MIAAMLDRFFSIQLHVFFMATDGTCRCYWVTTDDEGFTLQPRTCKHNHPGMIDPATSRAAWNQLLQFLDTLPGRRKGSHSSGHDVLELGYTPASDGGIGHVVLVSPLGRHPLSFPRRVPWRTHMDEADATHLRAHAFHQRVNEPWTERSEKARLRMRTHLLHASRLEDTMEKHGWLDRQLGLVLATRGHRIWRLCINSHPLARATWLIYSSVGGLTGNSPSNDSVKGRILNQVAGFLEEMLRTEMQETEQEVDRRSTLATDAMARVAECTLWVTNPKLALAREIVLLRYPKAVARSAGQLSDVLGAPGANAMVGTSQQPFARHVALPRASISHWVSTALRSALSSQGRPSTYLKHQMQIVSNGFHGLAFVITQHGSTTDIVGILALRLSAPGDYVVELLYVVPDARCRGVASSLWDAAVSHLDTFHALVDHGMFGVTRFWERKGLIAIPGSGLSPAGRVGAYQNGALVPLLQHAPTDATPHPRATGDPSASMCSAICALPSSINLAEVLKDTVGPSWCYKNISFCINLQVGQRFIVSGATNPRSIAEVVALNSETTPLFGGTADHIYHVLIMVFNTLTDFRLASRELRARPLTNCKVINVTRCALTRKERTAPVRLPCHRGPSVCRGTDAGESCEPVVPPSAPITGSTVLSELRNPSAPSSLPMAPGGSTMLSSDTPHVRDTRAGAVRQSKLKLRRREGMLVEIIEIHGRDGRTRANGGRSSATSLADMVVGSGEISHVLREALMRIGRQVEDSIPTPPLACGFTPVIWVLWQREQLSVHQRNVLLALAARVGIVMIGMVAAWLDQFFAVQLHVFFMASDGECRCYQVCSWDKGYTLHPRFRRHHHRYVVVNTDSSFRAWHKLLRCTRDFAGTIEGLGAGDPSVGLDVIEMGYTPGEDSNVGHLVLVSPWLGHLSLVHFGRLFEPWKMRRDAAEAQRMSSARAAAQLEEQMEEHGWLNRETKTVPLLQGHAIWQRCKRTHPTAGAIWRLYDAVGGLTHSSRTNGCDRSRQLIMVAACLEGMLRRELQAMTRELSHTALLLSTRTETVAALDVWVHNPTLAAVRELVMLHYPSARPLTAAQLCMVYAAPRANSIVGLREHGSPCSLLVTGDPCHTVLGRALSSRISRGVDVRCAASAWHDVFHRLLRMMRPALLRIAVAAEADRGNPCLTTPEMILTERLRRIATMHTAPPEARTCRFLLGAYGPSSVRGLSSSSQFATSTVHRQYPPVLNPERKATMSSRDESPDATRGILAMGVSSRMQPHHMAVAPRSVEALVSTSARTLVPTPLPCPKVEVRPCQRSSRFAVKEPGKQCMPPKRGSSEAGRMGASLASRKTLPSLKDQLVSLLVGAGEVDAFTRILLAAFSRQVPRPSLEEKGEGACGFESVFTSLHELSLLRKHAYLQLIRAVRPVGIVYLGTVAAFLGRFFRMRLRVIFRDNDTLWQHVLSWDGQESLRNRHGLHPHFHTPQREQAWCRVLALAYELECLGELDNHILASPGMHCPDVIEVLYTPGHLSRLTPWFSDAEILELSSCSSEATRMLPDLDRRHAAALRRHGLTLHVLATYGWERGADATSDTTWRGSRRHGTAQAIRNLRLVAGSGSRSGSSNPNVNHSLIRDSLLIVARQLETLLNATRDHALEVCAAAADDLAAVTFTRRQTSRRARNAALERCHSAAPPAVASMPLCILQTPLHWSLSVPEAFMALRIGGISLSPSQERELHRHHREMVPPCFPSSKKELGPFEVVIWMMLERRLLGEGHASRLMKLVDIFGMVPLGAVADWAANNFNLTLHVLFFAKDDTLLCCPAHPEDPGFVQDVTFSSDTAMHAYAAFHQLTAQFFEESCSHCSDVESIQWTDNSSDRLSTILELLYVQHHLAGIRARNSAALDAYLLSGIRRASNYEYTLIETAIKAGLRACDDLEDGMLARHWMPGEDVRGAGIWYASFLHAKRNAYFASRPETVNFLNSDAAQPIWRILSTVGGRSTNLSPNSLVNVQGGARGLRLWMLVELYENSLRRLRYVTLFKWLVQRAVTDHLLKLRRSHLQWRHAPRTAALRTLGPIPLRLHHHDPRDLTDALGDGTVHPSILLGRPCAVRSTTVHADLGPTPPAPLPSLHTVVGTGSASPTHHRILRTYKRQLILRRMPRGSCAFGSTLWILYLTGRIKSEVHDSLLSLVCGAGPVTIGSVAAWLQRYFKTTLHILYLIGDEYACYCTDSTDEGFSLSLDFQKISPTDPLGLPSRLACWLAFLTASDEYLASGAFRQGRLNSAFESLELHYVEGVDLGHVDGVWACIEPGSSDAKRVSSYKAGALQAYPLCRQRNRELRSDKNALESRLRELRWLQGADVVGDLIWRPILHLHPSALAISLIFRTVGGPSSMSDSCVSGPLGGGSKGLLLRQVAGLMTDALRRERDAMLCRLTHLDAALVTSAKQRRDLAFWRNAAVGAYLKMVGPRPLPLSETNDSTAGHQVCGTTVVGAGPASSALTITMPSEPCQVRIMASSPSSRETVWLPPSFRPDWSELLQDALCILVSRTQELGVSNCGLVCRSWQIAAAGCRDRRMRSHASRLRWLHQLVAERDPRVSWHACRVKWLRFIVHARYVMGTHLSSKSYLASVGSHLAGTARARSQLTHWEQLDARPRTCEYVFCPRSHPALAFASGREHMICTGCYEAIYCDAYCQQRARRTHRLFCRHMPTAATVAEQWVGAGHVDDHARCLLQHARRRVPEPARAERGEGACGFETVFITLCQLGIIRRSTCRRLLDAVRPVGEVRVATPAAFLRHFTSIRMRVFFKMGQCLQSCDISDEAMVDGLSPDFQDEERQEAWRRFMRLCFDMKRHGAFSRGVRTQCTEVIEVLYTPGHLSRIATYVAATDQAELHRRRSQAIDLLPSLQLQLERALQLSRPTWSTLHAHGWFAGHDVTAERIWKGARCNSDAKVIRSVRLVVGGHYSHARGRDFDIRHGVLGDALHLVALTLCENLRFTRTRLLDKWTAEKRRLSALEENVQLMSRRVHDVEADWRLESVPQISDMTLPRSEVQEVELALAGTIVGALPPLCSPTSRRRARSAMCQAERARGRWEVSEGFTCPSSYHDSASHPTTACAVIALAFAPYLCFTPSFRHAPSNEEGHAHCCRLDTPCSLLLTQQRPDDGERCQPPTAPANPTVEPTPPPGPSFQVYLAGDPIGQTIVRTRRMFRALGIEYGSSFRTRRKKAPGTLARAMELSVPAPALQRPKWLAASHFARPMILLLKSHRVTCLEEGNMSAARGISLPTADYGHAISPVLGLSNAFLSNMCASASPLHYLGATAMHSTLPARLEPLSVGDAGYMHAAVVLTFATHMTRRPAALVATRPQLLLILLCWSLPVDAAPPRLKVGYVNFRAGGSRAEGGGGAREAKIKFLLSQVAGLGLTILIVVEVWGEWKTIQELRQRFRDEAGMESRGKEGPTEGQQRVGGCLIFWKANQVAPGRTPFTPLYSKQSEGPVSRGNGGSVVLQPKGWSHPLTVIAAYGPQDKQDKVRFMSVLRTFLESIDSSYILAGDLQGVVSSEHTARGRPLHEHEKDLAGMLGHDSGSQAATPRVGHRLETHVDDRDCPFTHRDPKGRHASIDHFITGGTGWSDWVVESARFPRVSIGCYSGRPFDHAFMVAAYQPPEQAQLADPRLIRVQTARLPDAIKADLMRRIDLVPDPSGPSASEQLRALESHVTALVRDTCEARRDMPVQEVTRLTPAKDHVRYLQGVQRAITRRWDSRAFFTSWRSPLLAHGMWKNLAAKFGRQGWQRVRKACRSKVDSRLAFYTSQAYHEKSRLIRAAAKGDITYDSPQAAALMLQEAWREHRSGKRGGIVSMSKINVRRSVDGEEKTVLLSDGMEVMQEMSNYGAKQNRASNARPEVVQAMLDVFCPKWPELRDVQGQPWDLESVFTFHEFEKIVASFAHKACGLDGFQVDFLGLASRSVRSAYHQLLLRCMKEGTFPPAWGTLVGVLIEKKSPAPHDIEKNRDIWLVAAGAKVTQKCLQWNALEPIRSRILPCAAGSVRGRGGTEHVLTQRLLIRQALDLKSNVYVLWIDLVKCFMSFSRDCSQVVQEHLGVPQEARNVLRALYSEVRGRYDSAYGMTPTFDILRGLIQGALESPDLSLQLLNVMAEVMELKVLGFRHFNGTGMGNRTVQMLYVDDGANMLDREEHVHRAAFVWDVWARIFDTEVNVKQFEKSVVSGITHAALASDRYALRPGNASFAHPVRLLNGEVIPQLDFGSPYPYLGILISLDGKCKHHLQLVVQKYKGAIAAIACKPACRRRKVNMVNPFTLGYGIAHGVGLNLSFAEADATFGVLARSTLHHAKHTRARESSTPRWLAHAPSKPYPSSMAKARASREADTSACRLAESLAAPLVCGLNVVHPYAAICAGKHLAFWSCFSSPLPHMRRATHSAVALTLRRLGCRGEDPSKFDFAHHIRDLDMSHDVENWLWCVYILAGRKCGWTWCTPNKQAPEDSELRFTPGSGLFGTQRTSPPLWQGALWCARRRTSIRSLMAVVDELGHVCTTAGDWLSDFQEARLRWGPAGLENRMKADWFKLLRELQTMGACPCKGFGGLSLRQQHEGQQVITEGPLCAPRRDEVGTGGWSVDILSRLLTDGQPHSVASFASGFMELAGTATPRQAQEHPLAAPTRLELRAGPRRHVCWYNSKTPSAFREWTAHEAGGAGVALPSAATHSDQLCLLRQRFSILEDGTLADALPHMPAPPVVRLWYEAERRVLEAGITPNAAENAFVLDRLLDLEAKFGFLFAAATDGSVKRHHGENLAGRAALLAGDDGTIALGGAMPGQHEGFDTQSYDTELEAFSDVLSAVSLAAAGKRRVLIVTDCLSGSCALWRFHRRSMRERAGCFRDDRLAGLLVVEDKCEVVVYVWLHSHVDITLSEGADLAAKEARSGDITPSLTILRPHAVAVIPNVKRNHASAMIEAISVWILHDRLLGCSQLTLRPTHDTWEAFLVRDVERSPYPSDAVVETMDDLQADRLGLQGDRTWAFARRHSYGSFLRATPCALCSDPQCRQTREDVLFTCQAVAPEREAIGKALRSIVKDVPSAAAAVCAVEGGAQTPAARISAVRFLCGLPDAPGEWNEDDTQNPGLQRRVGRRVHGAVHNLVQRVLHLNLAARSSPAETAERVWTWPGIQPLGLYPRWCILHLSRRILHAWRLHSAANGPARCTARMLARPLKARVLNAVTQEFGSISSDLVRVSREVRGSVFSLQSTALAPTIVTGGLRLVSVWADRCVKAAHSCRTTAIRQEVSLRWAFEVEEHIPPRAREYEDEEISFGEMAAGWKWRLKNLLASWRMATAASFLERRDEANAVVPSPLNRLKQRERVWEAFHRARCFSPIPIDAVRALIFEEVRVRWSQCSRGAPNLVPAAADSSRETHRVLRASHFPGVLSLSWHPPFFAEKKYEEAVSALEAERQLVDHTEWLAARTRVEQAWHCCRNLPTLRRLMFHLLSQGRPIISQIWCPIDAHALQDWISTPEAQRVPVHKNGTSYGATGAQLAHDLLAACQRPRQNDDVQQAHWLHISYRHAALGEWLIASGWLSYSRLYALGQDPFRLPSAIRRIALGKFGFELDDAAAYLRIVALLVPALQRDIASFLESKPEIMDKVARLLLGHLAQDDAMTAAKELFLASIFGGDVFRWKRQHQVVGSVDNLVVRTSLGTFPVGKFCSALRGAAGEFAYAKPRLLDLVRACGKDEGAALSYAAQDVEGMLREVKRKWADIGGHHVFNLQHDGVAAGLAPGTSPEVAALELSHLETAVLRGHQMTVSAKHMGSDPEPFTSACFSDQAEAAWLMRHHDYRLRDAAPRESGHATSSASTSALEARMTMADATRRTALRQIIRCAQAELRMRWPSPPPPQRDTEVPGVDSSQVSMPEALRQAADAPSIPVADRWLLDLTFKKLDSARRRRAAAKAANRRMKRVLLPRRAGVRRVQSFTRSGPAPGEAPNGPGIRQWLESGSCSGAALTPVGPRVQLDLTGNRQKALRRRKSLARYKQRVEQTRDMHEGLETDASGRSLVRCILGVARPHERRGRQLRVRVRWEGVADDIELWEDCVLPVQRLTKDWMPCVRAMENLRYHYEENDEEQPQVAPRRSPRLRLPMATTPVQDDMDPVLRLEAQVAVVLAAHLSKHVDAGITSHLDDRALARLLGDVQCGDVEHDVVRNMWEDWGLKDSFAECLDCLRTWHPEGPLPQHARARRPLGTRQRPLRAGSLRLSKSS